MACPSDPEIERPKNFVEAISGDETWDKYGIRIKWTDPIVPGNIRFSMNEPVKLKLCVETKKEFNIIPEGLTAWCWTHIKTADNPCGIWKEIKLNYNPRCFQRTDQGHFVHVYQGFVVPTNDETYRLTFNVKYDKIMIWANYFRVDNLLDVHMRPSVATQYETGQETSPPWKNPLANMMPQSMGFPSVNLASLFCDKKDQTQSSPSQAARRKKKTEGSDGEDVEMLVML